MQVSGSSALKTDQVNESRETHVQSQMNRQGESILSLTNLAETLERRLAPVLRDIPPAPTQGTQNASIKPSLVGHAQAISNQTDQLEMLRQQLSMVLDRLEL